MLLQTLVTPWTGHAVRHIPAPPHRTYDIYDFRYCDRSHENCWNVAGEPTLYLAKEKNVALAEYARHFQVDRTPTLAAQIYRRKVYRFQVKLEATLDLCDPQVCQALSLANTPESFADKTIARAVAHFIRHTTRVEGIFVPSLAFSDNRQQWCLVIFLEKLPKNPQAFLPTVTEDGYFQVS